MHVNAAFLTWMQRRVFIHERVRLNRIRVSCLLTQQADEYLIRVHKLLLKNALQGWHDVPSVLSVSPHALKVIEQSLPTVLAQRERAFRMAAEYVCHVRCKIESAGPAPHDGDHS